MTLVKDAKVVFVQDCCVRYRDHYSEILQWGRETEVISETQHGQVGIYSQGAEISGWKTTNRKHEK